MQSRTFTVTVGAMAAIAVIGTIASAVALYRSTKRDRSPVTQPAGATEPPRRTRRVRS